MFPSKSAFACLAVCLLLQTRTWTQEVQRKLLYTAPDLAALIDIHHSDAYFFRYPLNPDFNGNCVITVKEKNAGYRVFYNGDDWGVFPEEPKFGRKGEPLLLESLEDKKYIHLNGKRHGPFSQIKNYDLKYGHLIVEHWDPVTQINYLYEDSVNIAAKKGVRFDWGPAPGIWKEYTSPYMKDVYLQDSLICKNCAFPNFGAAGDHYFIIYCTNGNKTAMTCIADGKDMGIIESYWAPQIDSYGNLFLPCQKKGKNYVQTNTELFGPIKNQETVKHSSGKFGLLFKFQKEKDLKNSDYLYANGQVFGPWDSLTLFRGCNVYYFETMGKRFLGRNGQTILSFEGNNRLKNIAFSNTGQYILQCTDGSVYRNDTLLGTFPALREMWINEAGNYFLLYDKKEDNISAIINGTEIDFKAENLGTFRKSGPFPYQAGPILLDDAYQHFLLYARSEPYFIIDGKRYPCVPEKTNFFYLKSIQSFCWTTIEENKLYWHSLKLE